MPVAETQRPVLVVDFGAQYAQLIARRVRESSVFSEVIPHTTTVEEIAERQPLAVILSGGPASVYAEGAPQLDARLFDLGLSEVGLALCAASSKSDQTLIAQIVAEHGRDGFLTAWLTARDAGWAVDLLPNFSTLIPLTERELQP